MRLVQADEVARRRMREHRAKLRRRRTTLVSASLLACFGVGLLVNAFRPLPVAALSVNTSHLELPAEITRLAWPQKGQAALYATDYGMLGSFGSDDQMPTASIAKVLTALCVLEKHPLKVGETGPTITFSKSDVALYQYQLEQNGSNVPIYEGSQMTEYEALEALLIPSANNIADSIAVWAFGSLDEYADYANEYALRNQLVKTTVGIDASGLDGSTKSTAADVAMLADLARQNPVIMEIAAKKTAELPNAGTVYNYNSALGVAGINGLKTGNNDGNRGALAFTADIKVGDRTIELSGAVMGQDTLAAAISRSIALVKSVAQNFEEIQIINSAEVVGAAQTAWGDDATIVASKPVTILRWKGSAVTTKYTVHDTEATSADTVGAIEIDAGAVKASVSLQVGKPAKSPDFWWRASRVPFI